MSLEVNIENEKTRWGRKIKTLLNVEQRVYRLEVVEQIDGCHLSLVEARLNSHVPSHLAKLPKNFAQDIR